MEAALIRKWCPPDLDLASGTWSRPARFFMPPGATCRTDSGQGGSGRITDWGRLLPGEAHRGSAGTDPPRVSEGGRARPGRAPTPSRPQSRPPGQRKPPALVVPVAPAHQMQLASVPHGQDTLGFGEQESQLGKTAALVQARVEVAFHSDFESGKELGLP